MEKLSKLYSDKKSTMPKQVDFTFDIKYSGIEITEQIREQIKDSFDKFNSDNLTVFQPVEMQKYFKQYGYDKTNPAMYSMISWVVEANEFSGTSGMTFEEFV
jgi:Ca2+-binding EF-hand superfamily protein